MHILNYKSGPLTRNLVLAKAWNIFEARKFFEETTKGETGNQMTNQRELGERLLDELLLASGEGRRTRGCHGILLIGSGKANHAWMHKKL
jgi:hypothetical protein